MMLKLTSTVCLTLLSFTCLAQQLADPTMPASYAAAKSSGTEATETTSTSPQSYSSDKLILNSTIVAPRHKLAIINGVQLKVGDDVNGATIRRITHQQVELEQEDGEIVTLSLQKSFISDMKSAP